MTVKEYALGLLHWQVQRDPWTREVMVAGGLVLDKLADRIVAISRFEDFTALNLDQVRYYEWLLGLDGDEKLSLEDRRAAILAAWQGAQKPSLASIQGICDAWQAGAVAASYEPGLLILTFSPAARKDTSSLRGALERVVPAHIAYGYVYPGLRIKDVHLVMSIAQMQQTMLRSFAPAEGG